MRSVSCWAKHNMHKARVLIILSETFLFILAVWLGILLLQSDIRLPDIVIAIPLSIFGAAVFIHRYRAKRKQRNKKGYWQQRLCFFLMGLSMFLLSSFMVGSNKVLTWNTYSSLSASEFSLLVKPAPSASTRFTATEAKKALHLLKKMQKHEGLKWLYVFLIILGTLVLLYTVAILACSLSCSGNGALAWIVALLGGGGIIFLCVWLIRKLMKDTPPKPAQTALATVPVTTI